MIKQKSHDPARSRTSRHSVGAGLRKRLLATIYELLQIKKEDAVFPRLEGHLMLGFTGSGKVLSGCLPLGGRALCPGPVRRAARAGNV